MPTTIVYAISRKDRHIRLTKCAPEPDTFLGSTYNIAHDQVDYRKRCADWVSKKLSDHHMAHHIGLLSIHLTHYANHGQQFLQYIFTGDDTFINNVTLNQYIIPDVEAAIISHSKGIQSNVISKEVEENVFCKHKGVLVDLLVVTL